MMSMTPDPSDPPVTPALAPGQEPIGKPSSEAVLEPMAAADLQDHLLVASNDLDRLQRLLDDASYTLLGHFKGAAEQIERALRLMAQQPDVDQRHLHHAMEFLAAAITGLQFQDMAAQLLQHTTRRLRGCADRLAASVMADDEDGPGVVEDLPMKPNPVTQDEMDAGSVELF